MENSNHHAFAIRQEGRDLRDPIGAMRKRECCKRLAWRLIGSFLRVALVAIALAIRSEFYHQDPGVEMTLFRERNLALSNIGHFLFAFGVFGSLALIAKMLGYTAMDARLRRHQATIGAAYAGILGYADIYATNKTEPAIESASASSKRQPTQPRLVIQTPVRTRRNGCEITEGLRRESSHACRA